MILILYININILKDVDIVASNDNITIKFLELVEFNAVSFRLNVIKYITVVKSKYNYSVVITILNT